MILQPGEYEQFSAAIECRVRLIHGALDWYALTGEPVRYLIPFIVRDKDGAEWEWTGGSGHADFVQVGSSGRRRRATVLLDEYGPLEVIVRTRTDA